MLTLPRYCRCVLCGEQADNRDAYEEALEDLKTVVLEEVRNFFRIRLVLVLSPHLEVRLCLRR